MSKVLPSLPEGLKSTGSEGTNSVDAHRRRISKVQSFSLKHSLKGLERQTTGRPGTISFKLTEDQIDALQRNLERKEKKIAKLWIGIALAVMLAVSTFVLTLASGYIANEESKESHINSGVMNDLSGDPVSVGMLETFSSIFDLPHYEAYTLSKIEHLSVKLNAETTASFEIASVLKSKVGCAESITLFTTEGNRIVVDSTTGIAAAYVGESQYLIFETDLEAERRHLYKSRQAEPRLYTKLEFFHHADNTDVYRHLNAATSSGWATFGLAIGQEILEEAGDALESYSSVYLKGETAGDERIPFEMLFDESGVENLIVKFGSDSDYNVNRFLEGSTETAQIAVKTAGEWTECELTSSFGNVTMNDLKDVMTITMINGARVLRSQDGQDIAVIFEVELNPPANKMEHVLPTDEECFNVPKPNTFVDYEYDGNTLDNQTESSGDRRLLGSWDWYWSNGQSNTYGHGYIGFGDHVRLSKWSYENWWPSSFTSRCYPDNSELDTYGQSAGLPSGYHPQTSGGAKKEGGFFDKEISNCWTASTIRSRTRGWLEEKVCMVHYDLSGSGALSTIASLIGSSREGDIRARFMYKEGQRASTMTIAFGGTDQKMDWLKFNLQITKRRFNSASTGVTTGSIPEYAYHNGDWNQAKYQYFHKGFADYVEMLEGCVQQYRQELWDNENIKITSIVGSSLGGAASVLYARKYGNAFLGVTTFGAPLTLQSSNSQVCDSDSTGIFGRRHYMEYDPVPSNILGMMGSFRHELEYVWKWKKEKECSKYFWGWCVGGWYVVRHRGRQVSCASRKDTGAWDLLTKGFGDHFLTNFDGSVPLNLEIGSA